jgi:phosphatidylinositol alpha-mannosyltransferase
VKIGIVTQSYYPRYGGVTENVFHTARELRARGHDVKIITSRFRSGETNHSEDVYRIGYNLLIPWNGAFADLTVGVHLARQMRALFEEHEFDVVHTHCPLVPTLPLLAVDHAPCPRVGTFHSTGERSLAFEVFHRQLERRIERLDGKIAVSRTAREFVARYFPGDYRVIPNGVDVNRFRPGVAPHPGLREPGCVHILFVGRLDPRKGVDVLLGAMPEVLERTRGRARLLLVGDSYLRARFEHSVPSSARRAVRFLGHVPSTDLPGYYAAADIFVSPATGKESFGIVLVEAMASGRPVVASDIPGYRSVITPDVDGVLVPPHDPRSLARAIAHLAGDETLRAELAARGRRRAQDFSWPKVTAQIESYYLELLGRRQPATSVA